MPLHRHMISVRLLILFCCVGLGLAVAFPSSPGFAKDKKPSAGKNADYALVKGSVFRDDGLSLRGARVTCRLATEKKPKWDTVSGEGGEFAFRLPVGKMEYVVSANFQGFEPVSKNVTIENDERQDISIVLTAKKP
jgi:hypothetical protein